MAEFDFAEARALLERTPALLDAWLRDLPAVWLSCSDGEGTWDAAGVVGHLIEGERDDWVPRVRHLLEHGDAVAFVPFDRQKQFERRERAMAELLDEFAALRRQSLRDLDELGLGPQGLSRRGRHPEFGVVTLGQHLATWVAHDLTHVTQIARVMAKRYGSAVGPWKKYLRVLND